MNNFRKVSFSGSFVFHKRLRSYFTEGGFTEHSCNRSLINMSVCIGVIEQDKVKDLKEKDVKRYAMNAAGIVSLEDVQDILSERQFKLLKKKLNVAYE